MQELQKYLVTIQNKDADLFDRILHRLSHQSKIKVGSRLSTIIPMIEKTIYEAELSEEEVVILTLSCPGEYEYFSDAGVKKAIDEYIAKNT